MRTLLVCLLVVLSSRTAVAQFKDSPNEADNGKGPTFGSEVTTRVQRGVTVTAGGLMYNGIATVPVPADWPEQEVKVVDEDVSASVKSLTYRNITGGGGVRQMVVQIPQLPPGQEAHALVTFEVTRRAMSPPSDTSIYQIPKRVDRETRFDLGPSPYIESRHPKIISAAREAVGEDQTAWQQAEAIYDWTRNHVTYKDGELKGAARALFDGEGYTDELASVFIAMCRAQKIPARTVFVEGHCYAEFHLVDDEGQGHWFPCQPAGKRSFGAIDEVRPILQKGDNFKNPENPKERLRYLREYFHANGRGAAPKVKFVNEPVAN